MSTRNQQREDQSWEDWFSELCRIAKDDGCEIRKGIRTPELEEWRSLYNERLSPRDAWEK